MNFPKNKNGDSIIPVSPNVKYVYVNQKTGDDKNLGTLEKPVKTTSKGFSLWDKTRQNFLCLNAGDEWQGINVPFAGGNSDFPNIITTYNGDARAKVKSPDAIACEIIGKSNTAVLNIHFYPASRGNDINGLRGISIVNSNNILIENCVIDGFSDNIVCEQRQVVKNITLRRNIIQNAYSTKLANGQKPHSQGIYCDYIDGLTIEENIIDNNGWKQGVSSATIFNHNVYAHGGTIYNLVVRGNVITKGSSHGLQQRAGGICEANFFYKNPINMSFGLVNGGGQLKVGGAVGEIKWNVFFGGGDISSEQRGINLQVGNTKELGVVDNIFGLDTEKSFDSIMLENCRGDFDKDDVGVKKLGLSNNVSFGWSKNDFSTNNISKLGTVTLADNFLPKVFDKSKISISGEITNPSYPDTNVQFYDFSSAINALKTKKWTEPPSLALINIARVGFGKNKIVYDYATQKYSEVLPLPSVPKPTIVAILLIDAKQDIVVGALKPGQVIDTKFMPEVNFVAETKDCGSVLFELNDYKKAESFKPFSAFGDNGAGDFTSWQPQVGNYELKVSAFELEDNGGVAGDVVIIPFAVKKTEPAKIVGNKVSYNDGKEFVDQDGIASVVVNFLDGTSKTYQQIE